MGEEGVMGAIRNLTPHPIRIFRREDAALDTRTKSYRLLVPGTLPMVEFPPEGGELPRVDVSEKEMGRVGEIPLIGVSYGAIRGLPEEIQGTYLIVSALAAKAARESGRTDCLIPTGMVRDEAGSILGCVALGLE
jgi:hypothetical protein